ncbi:DAK2 domain fusion protein YloV [Peptoanaerobacter stomatis]|uniref:DAK2 domain fusion protein YloV n=1 Tax=Peptoanaerobacter stomatis TaxID=796937 RepID=J5WF13_9FIRM|nr:DAK2 domain-containing protein [Peptoanaerobacter stomatis]EJU21492.1 DAK2 domain fusion protein YloV [Peptoanaerobacter stomatis]
MQKINSALLKDMFLGGANNLINNKAYVDKLNVFPVPDGDTGTNMSLTLKSAVDEINKNTCSTLKELGDSITKGSLMGARGNSGVILSQILRGFSKAIETKDALDIRDFALSLDSAKKVAYKAVIKPVEGTILTVIRETADYARDVYANYDNFSVFFDDLLKKANEVLQKTPELLKELKNAGVVDSGGQGLIFFIEGMVKTFKGEELKIHDDNSKSSEKLFEEDIHILDENPQFGYCTEFMLNTVKLEPNDLKEKIEHMGNSLIVVGSDNIIKVHIHSNNPGKVLEIAGEFGELDRIKIENMRLEFKERLEQNKEARKHSDNFEEIGKSQKAFSIISVSVGKGLNDIMKDFGVDYIIEGGQTMNPSTNDFLNAIKKINQNDIFIFPNNSNIIMAANQAKELSEKNIKVIPTKNIPQCIQALISMNTFMSFDENETLMSEAIPNVKSGQVTFAVRDTVSNGFDIKKGDFIGLSEKEILSCEKDANTATINLIKSMIDKNSEIVSIFYGEDIKQDKADLFKEELQYEFPDLEIEFYYGGQPIYQYLVSIE